VVAHGDCVGGDEEFNAIVLDARTRGNKNIGIHIFPPTDDKYRAYCGKGGSDIFVINSPNKYLLRNKHIVDFSDVMIAAPYTEEVVRSGTWSTVRYAIVRKKSIFIVYRDHIELTGGDF
jgi:hypothetical protein